MLKDADTIVLPRLRPAEVGAEDPWGEGRGAPGGEGHRSAPGVGPAGPHRPPAVAWLVPALLMAALSLAGAGAPGLGRDELATWRAATASWREAWSTLRGDDVAAAPYQLLMRAWVELFGTSDLALRVPSMLAMTAAAALVGVLGARLFTPRVGLLAGVVLALLPTSTRYAQEAQPYALTVLAAVLATLLLGRAVDRPTFGRFAAYGAAVLVLGLCHVHGLLLLAGHGWAVLAFRRTVAGRWLVAAVLGVLPAAALVRLGGLPGAPAVRVPDLAALAAAPRELFGVAALGAVLLLLALFSLPLRSSAAVFTAWAVVPPVALLLLAQAVPVWLPQGLLFTLPAWAVLAAVALARAHLVCQVVVLAAIAVTGAPAQLALREPDGHQQGTRQLAAIIERGMRPGDGVVYGLSDAGGGRAGRNLVARYLPADRRPADVLAQASRDVVGLRPPTERADVAGGLRDTRRLWVVRVGERADPLHGIAGEKERVLRTTYRVAQVWRPTGLTLALLVDEDAAV
ncbi:glycosyltransferase family 39 protein [Micromonospora olivasterospora]|uniref:Mannosyltransferase n=1 Tax=Micromonospora olivasterospora TaxID=1880 RepID=A0A562II01_MICOL|nr:glycosyltransferase family 39 protein [Micromonospora olivasterospora]TWH70446.1 mannosyltransferase [Micromonospora olivasterospora]